MHCCHMLTLALARLSWRHIVNIMTYKQSTYCKSLTRPAIQLAFKNCNVFLCEKRWRPCCAFRALTSPWLILTDWLKTHTGCRTHTWPVWGPHWMSYIGVISISRYCDIDRQPGWLQYRTVSCAHDIASAIQQPAYVTVTNVREAAQ